MKRAFWKWRMPTSRAQTGIRGVRPSPRRNDLPNTEASESKTKSAFTVILIPQSRERNL